MARNGLSFGYLTTSSSKIFQGFIYKLNALLNGLLRVVFKNWDKHDQKRKGWTSLCLING